MLVLMLKTKRQKLGKLRMLGKEKRLGEKTPLQQRSLVLKVILDYLEYCFRIDIVCPKVALHILFEYFCLFVCLIPLFYLFVLLFHSIVF